MRWYVMFPLHVHRPEHHQSFGRYEQLEFLGDAVLELREFRAAHCRPRGLLSSACSCCPTFVHDASRPRSWRSNDVEGDIVRTLAL
jgi:hypothetical protein